MGRFRVSATLVRVTPELTICFSDRLKIVVTERQTGRRTVFHRYGAPLGSYAESWGPFRNKMLRYKNLTMKRCHQIAAQHSVLYFSSDRPLQFEAQTINYRR